MERASFSMDNTARVFRELVGQGPKAVVKYVVVDGNDKNKVTHHVLDTFDTLAEADHIVNTLRLNRWGYSDKVTRIGEGIYFVSTRSHGGFVVSKARAKQIAAAYPGFKSNFSSDTEFEEDRDYAIVVMSFQDLFDEYEIYNAYRRLACKVGKEWVDVLRDEDRRTYANIVMRHAKDYVAVAYSSGVVSRVTLRRIGDGAEAVSSNSDLYYKDGFITEEELRNGVA